LRFLRFDPGRGTGSISGKVIDAKGEPIRAFVNVSGPHLPAGRTTPRTASGAFPLFQRLLPGKYTVESELAASARRPALSEVLGRL